MSTILKVIYNRICFFIHLSRIYTILLWMLRCLCSHKNMFTCINVKLSFTISLPLSSTCELFHFFTLSHSSHLLSQNETKQKHVTVLSVKKKIKNKIEEVSNGDCCCTIKCNVQNCNIAGIPLHKNTIGNWKIGYALPMLSRMSL